MRIAGHTIATPEYSLPEAIDLFAGLGMEGIEAICHDEYKSGVRTDISAEGLRGLRRRAEDQGICFAAITPYATDLNSPDERVASAHRGLLLRAIEIAEALGARTIRTYAGKETGGPGGAAAAAGGGPPRAAGGGRQGRRALGIRESLQHACG